MRLPNWRSRLYELTAEKENAKFEYGVNDCTLFAADVVQALTGNDPAKSYRGKYKTLLGGIRKLKAQGYSDHIDYIEKNYDETPVALANVGDLGVVEMPEGKAIVVIMGSFAMGLTENNGMGRIDVLSLKKAYRV